MDTTFFEQKVTIACKEYVELTKTPELRNLEKFLRKVRCKREYQIREAASGQQYYL